MKYLKLFSPFKILFVILLVAFVIMGIYTDLIYNYGQFIVVFFLIELILLESDFTLLRI
jgi:UDP-N-acetylglucosamine:LPS N-acetylglucosamine transferase